MLDFWYPPLLHFCTPLPSQAATLDPLAFSIAAALGPQPILAAELDPLANSSRSARTP